MDKHISILHLKAIKILIQNGTTDYISNDTYIRVYNAHSTLGIKMKINPFEQKRLLKELINNHLLIRNNKNIYKISNEIKKQYNIEYEQHFF